MTDLSETTKQLSEIAELMKDLTRRESRLLKATMFGPEMDICGITVPAGVADYVHNASHNAWWDFMKAFKLDAIHAIRDVEELPEYKTKRWDTTKLAWVDA